LDVEKSHEYGVDQICNFEDSCIKYMTDGQQRLDQQEGRRAIYASRIALKKGGNEVKK